MIIIGFPPFIEKFIRKGGDYMYCKLKDKEVYVFVLKDGIVGSKKIQIKDCTGNYNKDISGKRVRIQCDMARHDECLLNK